MDTSEKDFEATVQQTLLNPAEAGVAGDADVVGYRERQKEHYDRNLCLDTGVLFDFIYTSQPQTWEKLKQQHGEAQVKPRFLKRLTL